RRTAGDPDSDRWDPLHRYHSAAHACVQIGQLSRECARGRLQTRRPENRLICLEGMTIFPGRRASGACLSPCGTRTGGGWSASATPAPRQAATPSVGSRLGRRSAKVRRGVVHASEVPKQSLEGADAG
ncbi:MAG: hypothetical protein OET79_13845, partial [Nitrospirota bacterium]|nr:hypothetical protein [Nitrospirota bacterium]